MKHLRIRVRKDRISRIPSPPPIRNAMMPDEWYANLDPGIVFAVRVLHAAGGVETCQSCQGGKGHVCDRPTVDLIAGSDDALGFRALAALQEYGLPVSSVALVWSVRHGLPYERIWRIEFFASMFERVDERPSFIRSYQAV